MAEGGLLQHYSKHSYLNFFCFLLFALFDCPKMNGILFHVQNAIKTNLKLEAIYPKMWEKHVCLQSKNESI